MLASDEPKKYFYCCQNTKYNIYRHKNNSKCTDTWDFEDAKIIYKGKNILETITIKKF